MSFENVNRGVTVQGQAIFTVAPDGSGFKLEAGDTQVLGDEVGYVDLEFCNELRHSARLDRTFSLPFRGPLRLRPFRVLPAQQGQNLQVTLDFWFTLGAFFSREVLSTSS